MAAPCGATAWAPPRLAARWLDWEGTASLPAGPSLPPKTTGLHLRPGHNSPGSRNPALRRDPASWSEYAASNLAIRTCAPNPEANPMRDLLGNSLHPVAGMKQRPRKVSPDWHPDPCGTRSANRINRLPVNPPGGPSGLSTRQPWHEPCDPKPIRLAALRLRNAPRPGFRPILDESTGE